MICPKCRSAKMVKNGRIHNGKPKFKGNKCGRQFALHPNNKRSSSHLKTIIDKLWLERISLAVICRATSVSPNGLSLDITNKYEKTNKNLKVITKNKAKWAVPIDKK